MGQLFNEIRMRFRIIKLLLKKYGLLGTLKFIRTEILYDYQHGVDTYAPVSGEQLFEEGRVDVQNRYVSSTFTVIDFIKRKCNERLGQASVEESNFIDYGSGKGKVVMAMASHGFGRVKGLEYSDRLHQIALTNIEKIGIQSKVNLIRGDAAQFIPDPIDRVLYFFNPFSGAVLEQCLNNIQSVTPSGPRFLILVNPEHAGVFERFFEEVEAGLIQPGDIGYRLYTDKSDQSSTNVPVVNSTSI